MDGSGLGRAQAQSCRTLKAGRYRLQPAAGDDLNRHADRLLTDAGPDVAERFVDNARASFTRLADTPGIGSPVPSKNVALTGMRKWRVSSFPKVLIFYLTAPDSIDIVRVLHASQDWAALFDAD